jgi:hypothetical protein
VQIARQVKQEIASLAVLGIVGWLLAFAVHLHLPGQQQQDGGPHQVHHPCLLCAAFQSGAGPAAALPALEAAKPSWTESLVLVPDPTHRPFTAYRSRAPPVC